MTREIVRGDQKFTIEKSGDKLNLFIDAGGNHLGMSLDLVMAPEVSRLVLEVAEIRPFDPEMMPYDPDVRTPDMRYANVAAFMLEKHSVELDKALELRRQLEDEALELLNAKRVAKGLPTIASWDEHDGWDKSAWLSVATIARKLYKGDDE